MRVVVWNCNGGFRTKRVYLEQSNFDIAIVPEVFRKDISSVEEDQRTAMWRGSPDEKGIAVLVQNGWQIQRVHESPEQKYFVPLTLSNGKQELLLIAIWVLLHDSSYVSPTIDALEALKPLIQSSTPCVLAGDFNQNVRWDRDKGRYRFAEVIASLERLGLVSAWHTIRSEQFANESEWTHFHTWNRAKRHHIDYLFGPAEWFKTAATVNIGGYDEWVGGRRSDHVPMIVDLTAC